MKKILAILLTAAVLMTAAGCTVNYGGLVSQLEDQAQSIFDTKAPLEATAAPAETSAPQGERVDFSAVDVNGDPISMADFADAKVVMINFFETWCPPCMGEIPDLVALYEKYRDEGFVILGVFGSSDKSAMQSVIAGQGITYPVFEVTNSLTKYQTQYVPTTIFTDGSGNLLSEEPYIGSKSYAEWESVITSFLNK